jgi:microcompartment protein CcmK/EutM
MTTGIVTASVVATEKHPELASRKLLLVQPTDLLWQPRGRPFVAVDAAQAGIGDRVLVVDEGGSARLSLPVPGGPEPTVIRTVIVGIVDALEAAPGASRGEADGGRA